MRKLVVPLLALALIAAGCGGDKKETAGKTTGGASATPAVSASLAPGETPAATKAAAAVTAAPGQKQTTGGGGGGTSNTNGGTTAAQTAAPAKKPAAGGVNQPKAGTYVYDLDGKASDPLNPAGGQQAYPSDAEVRHDISNSGNVTTDEQTTSEGAGVFTIKTRYDKDKVVMLSINIESPLGAFRCTFDPPLLITHIPIKAETIPTQNFKGSGNACNGKLGIKIEGQETVKDAKGKAWPTWRVRVHTEASGTQFSQTSDEVRWTSPDLGMSIRSQGSATGWFKASAAAPKQNISQTSKTALKQYP